MTEAEWIAFFRRPEIPAFNAKMLEHPDADLPRLVFADWVEENCSNTQFVMALRRSIASPDIPEWVPNFSMVVKGHELRLWRGRIEVGVYYDDPEFDPKPDEFVKAAWESEWVGRVKLRGLKDSGSTVVLLAKRLGGVEWLDLHDSGIAATNLRVLIGAAPLESLRVLDLRWVYLGDDEALRLATLPALAKLDRLLANPARITISGLRTLSQSTFLPEHIRAQFRQPT